MALSSSSPRTRLIAGIAVPNFVYGTAWKEDATERLVAPGARGRLPRHRHREPAQALPRGGRRRGRRRAPSPRARHARRALPADQVHLRGRPGPSPAVRSRARRRGTQVRAVVRELARAPGRRATSTRTCCTARRSAHGLARRRPRRCGRRWRRLHAPAQTRFLGVSNVGLDQLEALCAQRRRHARLRAEPLLRAHRLGPRGARLLPRARHRLPGLLAAHRQPGRAAPPGVRTSSCGAWADAGAGRVPLRAPGRHAAAHRHDRPGPHARGPRRVRLRRSPPRTCAASRISP